MTEQKHVPGPQIFVEGTTEGLVPCAACAEEIQPEDVYMMLRHGRLHLWDCLCRPCARVLIRKTIKAYYLTEYC